MKKEIVVPRMGESITEVTIGYILKISGSIVKADEEILELETDKVNQALYAPEAGVIVLKCKQGDVVKVGDTIGYIEATTAEVEEKPPVAVAEEKPPVAVVEEKPPVAVVEEKPQERSETREKFPKIRQVIAERLVEAQKTAAMLTTFNEVDLTQVILLKEKYKDLFQKDYNVKLGYMSFFIKASVSALEAFPIVNAYLDGEELVYRNHYDISIAISTEKGLIVPVIKDCDKLGFAEIEKALDQLTAKARNGTMTVDELKGGGFTITNGGIFGSLLSTPILNPPQAAILGMHKIQKRAVVIDDQVVIRPMMYLALTYDHRILDGRDAVSFLVHIKECLEDPSRILLEV